MNVLVLGASGIAGHVISTHLIEQGHTVKTVSARRKLNSTTKLVDATDKMKLLEELQKDNFDVIINCIATLVKESKEANDKAIYLNSYLPKLLEKQYLGTPKKVIHISTDAVFSGTQTEYYEDSLYDGQSFYGRTKALGEINNNKDLTIRTSIIGPDISADGPSLFNWFYHQSDEIQGYADELWKGVTTVELAKAIVCALEQSISGIYHLVPPDSITKLDLLLLLKRVFNKNHLDITPSSGRGHNVNLINTRKDFVYTLPSYQDMIGEMAEWIQNHKDLYPHY